MMTFHLKRVVGDLISFILFASNFRFTLAHILRHKNNLSKKKHSRNKIKVYDLNKHI